MSRRLPISLAVLALGAASGAHAAWSRIGPEGAGVCRVAVAPGDPERLYAGPGTHGSGVFRSEDAGRSWTLAAGGLPPATPLCALAVDPRDADRVFTLDFLPEGDGLVVLASADAGRSWAPAGSFPASFGRDLVALREGRRTILLAAADNRVMRSADGGATWAAATGLPGGGFRTVWRLTVDPFARGRVYAAVEQGGIFVSSDGGRSFLPANRGLRRPLLSFLEVVADPRRQGRLWALADEGGRWEVYRSADAGRSWRASSGGLPAGPEPPVSILDLLPAGGDLVLATVSGEDLRLRLLRSRDGGATWEPAGGPPPPAGDLVDVGSDILAVGFQGLFRTTDRGGSWRQSAGGMRGGTIAGLAVDPGTPGVLVGGFFPQGLVRTLDGGGAWTALGKGPAGGRIGPPLAMAPSRPRRLALRVEYPEFGGAVATSVNRGATWRAGPSLACLAVSDLDFSPRDPRLLVVTGFVHPRLCRACTTYRSLDFGATWECLEPALPAGTRSVGSFTFAPGGERLFATGSEGRLLRSRDGGASWEVVSEGFLADLSFDAGHPQRLYALRDGAVVRSGDGGETWTPAAPLGDAGYGNALAADPGRPLHVFAATLHGVFETLDGGDTWLDLGDGLAEVAAGPLFSLDVGPGAGGGLVLYAGTLGSGLLARALPPAAVCGTIVGLGCPAGEFCELPAGQCSTADLAGVCRPLAEACPALFDPVCGCDGVTYANDCERQRAGAQLDRKGEC